MELTCHLVLYAFVTCITIAHSAELERNRIYGHSGLRPKERTDSEEDDDDATDHDKQDEQQMDSKSDEEHGLRLWGPREHTDREIQAAVQQLADRVRGMYGQCSMKAGSRRPRTTDPPRDRALFVTYETVRR